MVAVYQLHNDGPPAYVRTMTYADAMKFVRNNRAAGVGFTPQWGEYGDITEFYSADAALEWLSTKVSNLIARGLRPTGL
jgi:hypothetical protein